MQICPRTKCISLPSVGEAKRWRELWAAQLRTWGDPLLLSFVGGLAGMFPDPHPPRALVSSLAAGTRPLGGWGGLTPAQRSSDSHYVWQLRGLCVLEGPACVLTGAGRWAASLCLPSARSPPPAPRTSASPKEPEGEADLSPTPARGSAFSPQLCLSLCLPFSVLLSLPGPSAEIQAVAAD